MMSATSGTDDASRGGAADGGERMSSAPTPTHNTKLRN